MIAPDKRKAICLLQQEGMSLREIARRLGLGRNSVRRILDQAGAMPARTFTPPVDPDLLRALYQECHGYGQRVWEKLQEEHGLKIKYSSLTRWLRQLGVSLPAPVRCDRVPDEPGAEMQHDTSPFTIALGPTRTKLQASLLYLRYSKRRYLQFYGAFDRFQMKCFLHRALQHWGYAPGRCIIDNTNLARLRGLGGQALSVPEMEAFAKTYGFRFVCHACKHPDRKAGEERSFYTVETNFLPGRAFTSLADLNGQALAWSTVRQEQRPQGKAGLIPAQAFAHEQGFLQPLPPALPAPYKLLERSVDEYGYVAVEANYYWVPGTGRGDVRVLRYDQHLEIYQLDQLLTPYPLPPPGVRNQLVHPPGQPVSRFQPRHRPQPSDQEQKRLRELAPAVSAYVDFILATPGRLPHQQMRRLLALSQRMTPALFTRSVARAQRYGITSLATLEQIARLLCQAEAGELPLPPIDESFQDRPTYQAGALTDAPDLAQYE
jgi:AcrR family transcriptional regulator